MPHQPLASSPEQTTPSFDNPDHMEEVLIEEGQYDSAKDLLAGLEINDLEFGLHLSGPTGIPVRMHR